MGALEVSMFRSTIRVAGSAAALLAVFSVAPAAAATNGLRLAPSTASSSFLDRAASQGKEAKKLELVRGARTMSPSACAPSTIACNSSVSGTLTTDDCPFGDGSFYDRWNFQATSGQQVTISMTAAYDTVLWLYNPNGDLAAFNDDISYPDNTNSRIEFTINMTGTWVIWANSYDPGVTGAYSLDLQCTGGGPPPPPPPTCTASATALCLNAGRFRVQAIFSAPSLGIVNGQAQSVSLTPDTGYFWFFSSNNVEIVIKAVDGRPANGYFWVFYGALSDVEYTITVTDTVTGAVKTYTNTQGHLASVADVTAFPGGATVTGISAKSADSMADLVGAQEREVSSLVASSASLVCLSDTTTLCLNNGRFQVRVIFSAPSLGIVNGQAQANPLTPDTGYFWFFSSNNVEIVIKAVDGRPANGYFWVFYGALSDVEYTITVTDTVTGAVKTYANTRGHLASVADVVAFQ
jgi:hypothetical protein